MWRIVQEASSKVTLFLHTTLWDVAEAISENLCVDLIKAWVNGEDLTNV